MAWAFTKEVAKQWWALMANVVSVLLWLAETYAQWKVPHWIYLVILCVSLVLASFLAWKSEHEGRNRAESKVIAKPPAAADWKDLADRFKQIGAFSVRADWLDDNGKETWRLAGSVEQCKQYHSLAELVGAMLMRSPNVSRTLSKKVRSEPDPSERWLQFLKEREGLSDTDCLRKVGAHGEVQGMILAGSIGNLPDVSFRACIHCAATEI